jgi:hypothetical protein
MSSLCGFFFFDEKRRNHSLSRPFIYYKRERTKANVGPITPCFISKRTPSHAKWLQQDVKQ